LARLLARQPDDRLASADEAAKALGAIADQKLPDPLRRCLEHDYAHVIDDGFAARFYARLFHERPSLRTRFTDVERQSTHLADAVRDLDEFREEDGMARFLDHVGSHRRMRLDVADVDAFRHAFVAEMVAACGDRGGVPARTHGDAWNAALKLGLGVMVDHLAAAGS
jgi:hypothetical protein